MHTTATRSASEGSWVPPLAYASDYHCGSLAGCADYNDWKAVLPPVSDGENGRLRVIVPGGKQRFILIRRPIRLMPLAHTGIDSDAGTLGASKTAHQLSAESPRSPRPAGTVPFSAYVITRRNP